MDVAADEVVAAEVVAVDVFFRPIDIVSENGAKPGRFQPEPDQPGPGEEFEKVDFRRRTLFDEMTVHGVSARSTRATCRGRDRLSDDSQIRTTRQPSRLSAALLARSRAMFRSILVIQ